MESSPLRFLDFDASLMLADQVRLSQEQEARKFYEIVYYHAEYNNLNQDNHNLMSRVFDEVYYNIQNNRHDLSRDYRWAHGKTWFELSIHERLCIFEEERCEEEESQYISDRSWYNYLHMSKP